MQNHYNLPEILQSVMAAFARSIFSRYSPHRLLSCEYLDPLECMSHREEDFVSEWLSQTFIMNRNTRNEANILHWGSEFKSHFVTLVTCKIFAKRTGKGGQKVQCLFSC